MFNFLKSAVNAMGFTSEGGNNPEEVSSPKVREKRASGLGRESIDQVEPQTKRGRIEPECSDMYFGGKNPETGEYILTTARPASPKLHIAMLQRREDIADMYSSYDDNVSLSPASSGLVESTIVKHRDSSYPQLEGLTFNIQDKFEYIATAASYRDTAGIKILSIEEIDEEFSYSFELEKEVMENRKSEEFK